MCIFHTGVTSAGVVSGRLPGGLDPPASHGVSLSAGSSPLRSLSRNLRRRVTPGCRQTVGWSLWTGARSGSALCGGIRWTRRPDSGGATCVHHRSGSFCVSSTNACCGGAAKMKLSRSVLPPADHPTMWCMRLAAGGESDPGAELIPSSPTSASYWSRLPSRRVLPKNRVRPSNPWICRQPVMLSGSLTRVETGTWTPTSVRAVPHPE